MSDPELEEEEVYCPFCAGLQWEFVPMSSFEYFFICPKCRNSPIGRYDEECDSCNWKVPTNLFEQAMKSSHAKLLSKDPNDFLLESYNLCCDESEFKCQCPIPVYWDDVKHMVDTLYVDVFCGETLPNHACVECVRFQTPGCLPLRKTIKDWASNNFSGVPLKLLPCSLYEVDEEVYGNLTPQEEADLSEIIVARTKDIEYGLKALHMQNVAEEEYLY